MCLALPSLKNLTASMSSHRYSTLCRLIFNPYKAEKRLLCCCAFNLKLFEINDRVKKEFDISPGYLLTKGKIVTLTTTTFGILCNSL